MRLVVIVFWFALVEIWCSHAVEDVVHQYCDKVVQVENGQVAAVVVVRVG